MSLYDVTANFAAIDGISNVAQGIGNSIVKMASDATAGLEGLSGALASVATGGLAMLAAGAAIGVAQMDEVSGAVAKMNARLGASLDSAQDLKVLEQSAKDLFNTGLTDNFNDAARAVENMYGKLHNLDMKDFDHVGANALAIAKAWDTNSDSVINLAKNYQDKFPQITYQTDAAAGATKTMTAATGKYVEMAPAHTKAIDKLDKAYQKAQTALASYTDHVDKHGKATAASATHHAQLQAKLDATKSAYDKATASTKVWVSAADSVAVANAKMSTTTMTAEHAMDLLVRTAQLSHMPLDQINNIVQRYGSTFADAGVSAEGMSGILANAASNGVTNFAQLSGSIDHFHQGIINPPKGFNQALSDMGLSSVANDLRTNKITMDQALDNVFTKFSEMPNSVDKAKLAVDLFGKGVDKIGGAEALAQLQGFNHGFEDLAGSADKVTGIMEDDGTLGTALRKAGNNFKTWLGDKAEEVWRRLKSIDWGQIGESIHAMVTWAGGKWREFTTGLETTVHDAITGVTTWINAHAGNIVKAIQVIVDTVGNAWKDFSTKLVSGVESAFTHVSVVIDGYTAPILTSLQGVISSVSDAWNKFFGSNGTLQKAVNDAGTAITTAITVANNNIGPIMSAMSKEVGSIISSAQSVADTIGGVMNAIANAIMTALKPVIDIVNGLTDAISHLPGGGGGSGSGSGGGGGGGHGHAMGGDLDEGWNVVGEQGPELVNKSGTSATVFSNSESKKLLGSGGGSSGGNVYISVSAGTLVGSDGMDEFSRMLYRKFKDEDKRRGLTS